MIKGFKTYMNSLGLGYVISLVYSNGKESKSYFSSLEKTIEMKNFLIAKGYSCLN